MSCDNFGISFSKANYPSNAPKPPRWRSVSLIWKKNFEIQEVLNKTLKVLEEQSGKDINGVGKMG